MAHLFIQCISITFCTSVPDACTKILMILAERMRSGKNMQKCYCTKLLNRGKSN